MPNHPPIFGFRIGNADRVAISQLVAAERAAGRHTTPSGAVRMALRAAAGRMGGGVLPTQKGTATAPGAAQEGTR